jgi:hypothetical protein
MFSSITELRILLKYDESAFKISFDNIHNRLIGKTLENQCNKISNDLIIYTLHFLGEILSIQDDDINNNIPEDWISDLYWSILQYIFHDDERIKKLLDSEEIDSCFTLDYYLVNVDYIFNRLNIK